MKRFSVGLAAAVAMLALTTWGQSTNVYSKNAVGVIKVTIPANRWILVSHQLNPLNTSNRIQDILGTTGIPDGAVALFFNGVRYVGEEFIEGFGWDPGTNTVARGVGFWMRSPVGFDLFLTGEVPSETNTTVNLPPGYRLVAFPYPVEVDITNSVLNTVAQDGDGILRFTGTNYVGAEFLEGYGWDPPNFKLKIGEAYWYLSGGNKAWNEPKNKHYTYP